MRNLGFEDTPDYEYLRGLLTEALKSAGEIEDGEYDWMDLDNGRGRKFTGVDSSSVPQVRHSNVHQNAPTAVVVHNQSKKRYPPTRQHHLLELLPDRITTRCAPERNRDQAASCQAQFQHSQSNLDETQYRTTPSQSTSAQRLHQEQVPQTAGFVRQFFKILCCN